MSRGRGETPDPGAPSQPAAAPSERLPGSAGGEGGAGAAGEAGRGARERSRVREAGAASPPAGSRRPRELGSAGPPPGSPERGSSSEATSPSPDVPAAARAPEAGGHGPLRREAAAEAGCSRCPEPGPRRTALTLRTEPGAEPPGVPDAAGMSWRLPGRSCLQARGVLLLLRRERASELGSGGQPCSGPAEPGVRAEGSGRGGSGERGPAGGSGRGREWSGSRPASAAGRDAGARRRRGGGGAQPPEDVSGGPPDSKGRGSRNTASDTHPENPAGSPSRHEGAAARASSASRWPRALTAALARPGEGQRGSEPDAGRDPRGGGGSAPPPSDARPQPPSEPWFFLKGREEKLGVRGKVTAQEPKLAQPQPGARHQQPLQSRRGNAGHSHEGQPGHFAGTAFHLGAGRGASARRAASRPTPSPGPGRPQARALLFEPAPRAPSAFPPRRPRPHPAEHVLPPARSASPPPRAVRTSSPPTLREKLPGAPPLCTFPCLPARDSGEWAVASGSQPRPPARPPPGARHSTPLPVVSTHPRGGGGWRAAALLNPRAHLHGPAPHSDTAGAGGPVPPAPGSLFLSSPEPGLRSSNWDSEPGLFLALARLQEGIRICYQRRRRRRSQAGPQRPAPSLPAARSAHRRPAAELAMRPNRGPGFGASPRPHLWPGLRLFSPQGRACPPPPQTVPPAALQRPGADTCRVTLGPGLEQGATGT
uniref:basic proline-rich protein-like n=1 Tax=Odobenus rosmarus divergens TaxID=9708 RepID=UPI00063C7CB3|nr:PREDICTED: basic proline-rich protein-like [Odobenus rosmarus divergens]